MHIKTVVGLLVFLSLSPLLRADEESKLRLDAPSGWGGERISLPPKFAPAMKLSGIEEIRFAPGMFKADSDSFFSYVFVFELAWEPDLSKEVLEREFLAYYRGLAAAVLKGRDVKLDPKTFRLQFKPFVPDERAGRPPGARSYRGDLNWLEPFVSRKPQTLHVELDAWSDAANKRRYLFVCVSPLEHDKMIWRQMRSIRASFYKSR